MAFLAVRERLHITNLTIWDGWGYSDLLDKFRIGLRNLRERPLLDILGL
jgi:hypothetical protein